jgi:hypothetical protein
MKQKIALFLAFAFSLSLFSQVTKLPNWIVKKVYIDPSYSGALESGTEVAPYKSTKSAGFAWTAKNTYLFKRNTTMYSTKNELINKDSIIIGTYGIGERPKLNYDVKDRVLNVSGTGSSVNDIDLTVTVDTKTHGISMTGDYGTINNCVIKGGTDCINGSGMKHLKIMNSDISGAIYDGIFVMPTDTVTIFNCYVHDQYLLPDRINQTSIDNIHMEELKMVYIDSVYSDHSNFPGKYCLIINKVDSVSVKNSTFIGHPENGSLYPGTSSKGWTIQNCFFERGYYAIQNNTKLKICNTIFRGQLENAIYEGGDKWIFNCTFVDQKEAIRNWSGTVKVMENCIFYNFSGSILGNAETISKNCFFGFHGLFVGSNYNKGINYITQDPMFVDYANANYRLMSNSPCKDIGLSIPEVSVDFSGTARPQGSIDLGAYEYIDGLPKIFDVSTDGTGCEKDTAAIKLSGSETGMIYTLYMNNVKLKQSKEGTGSALNFGDQVKPGKYSVIACPKGTNKINKMKGEPKVLLNPLPENYYVLGGGYYNPTIGGAPVDLSQSDTSVNYQLYLNDVKLGSPISGTGNGISFGILPNNGIYTVIATDTKTQCISKMSNFNLNFDKSKQIFNYVSIYNIAGALVFQKNIELGSTFVPITLNSGTGEYIVRLSSINKQYQSEKILIK